VSSVWNDIQERLVDADVLIGGVYVRAQKAPVLVDEALLKLISVQPKLLIDVAADQGGNFFGSRSTTWQNPLYLDSFRNLRFGVSNLPSLCPRYASLALEDATLDYTLALCKGLKNGIKLYPELKTAISTFEGKLVQPQVAQIHHFPFTDLKELL
jgi:alanine dehydrogenase